MILFSVSGVGAAELEGSTTAAVAGLPRGSASGGRPAPPVAVLLRGLHEVELTSERARRIGALFGQARSCDVIDGSIIDAAADGDEILTSDPDDIATLAQHSRKNLVVTRV